MNLSPDFVDPLYMRHLNAQVAQSQRDYADSLIISSE